jgi:hypothetical protein
MGRCKPKEFDDLFKLKKLKGYGVYDLTEVKFTVDFYPQAVGFRSTLEEVPEWVKLKSKKSIAKIINDDDFKLCGQRCLVLGMCDNAQQRRQDCIP